MLDAATSPTASHLNQSRPHDDVELSDDLAAAYGEAPVTFTSVLPVPRRVVTFLADLHEKRFAQLRTRPERRRPPTTCASTSA